MLEDAGIKTLGQLERDIPTWINTLKQTIDILKEETEVEITIKFKRKSNDGTNTGTNKANLFTFNPNSLDISSNR
jgi:hypothetical protein